MLQNLNINFIQNIGVFFEEVTKAVKSFNFVTDLLDIILVAFVVYSLVKLIKDTRASLLVKGVVLLAVAYLVVSFFKMEVSKYILGLVFGNLLIILVIIFAPEIRQALESVGRSSVSNINFFGLKNRDESAIQEAINNSINSVCRACSDLSDKQIGALIVFENEITLNEISKTGTLLDATVSQELICNIFFPKSPMHDGAVVINEGRVVSAGCILPLTSKNNLSSDLGTRHRAAIGMSESSDAIVVVVSEETGIISIADKGIMKRDISAGELREILTKAFVKNNDKDGSRIKNFFRGK